MNDQNAWIDIITKLYKDLHMSERVMHTAKESDKKRDKIAKYFERLDRVQKKIVESKNKTLLTKLKECYYKLYIIKPENISDKYFANEQRILRERGYGDIEYTPERKKMLIDQILDDQKKSLEPWIDYFLLDEEGQSYDIWEKFWVFQGIQQLGKYDKEKFKFSKRDKTTVYPFPPVEREAVFETIKLMEEYLKNKTGDEEIKSALGEGNFKVLYEYSLKQIMLKGNKEKQNTTKGKWIKYNQGSDYNILRDSLQGYYTGWCTAAGENFAKSQLAKGDFYVYYTLDEKEIPKVPRIAIRMEGHYKIGEIRGIADNQNMEPEMMPILNEKLKEFPDRDKYYKKEYNMQYLTSIDNKVQKGIKLSKSELKFLYEIDGKIEGFGYDTDPRIKEIKQKRDNLEDYSIIFECDKNKISDDINDIYNEKDIMVFVGDLNIIENLHLPQVVLGSISLEDATNIKKIKFPQTVRDNIWLGSLVSAEDIILPQTVGGDINLDMLKNAKNVIFPNTVGGNLCLGSLTNADSITFPQNIGGDLYLDCLTSTNGIIFPQNVEGGVSLGRLECAENTKFPETVGGDIYLNKLANAKNVVFPENIGGDIFLIRLTNTDGIIFPKSFSWPFFTDEQDVNKGL